MTGHEIVSKIFSEFNYGTYNSAPEQVISSFDLQDLTEAVTKETGIRIPRGVFLHGTTNTIFKDRVIKILERGYFDKNELVRERIKLVKDKLQKNRNIGYTLDLNDLDLDELPKEILEIRDIVDLRLGFNNFKRIPDIVFQLENLTVLEISSCFIEEVPDLISNLPLEELFLDNNNLKNFPVSVTNIPTLKRLILSNSGSLEKHSNQIYNISASIENLQNLEFLSLGRNPLTSLPVELFTLKKLTYLNLDFAIKGEDRNYTFSSEREPDIKCLTEIPKQIGNLDALEVLSIQYHQIEVIPDEIVKLQFLKELQLRENSIKEIPSAIGNLQVEELDLALNKITQIPFELGNCPNLYTLNLYGNPLTETALIRLREIRSSKTYVDILSE